MILVEAQPRRASDGAAEIVRLAGGGGALPFHYADVHWRAGITTLPTFICSLDFNGTDLGTGGVPQATELEWGASRSADLAARANYVWTDAPIVVRMGPEGSLPPVRLSGKVLAATVDGANLKLALADPAADLKKALLTDRYGGTGDLDGPVEWKGKIKRRIWGRVWNMAGEPIDPPNNVYAFSDPLRALQEFTAVRDKGATAAAVAILPWQGSAIATLMALRGSVAPQGGGVLAPSIACVKWWTQPAGDLTADIMGEIAGGYVETTAAIAERLVTVANGPAFAAGTVADAIAARPAPVGWVASNESTTAAEMLDQLLGNSSLLWLINQAGEIVLREWAWGAPVASAVSHEVKRSKSFRPVATRRLGYRRNELPMARGDIAAIVLTGDIQYPDGTPIEEVIQSMFDAIGTALTDASNAQATADGKIASYYQPTPPLNPDVGDLWFDTDEGNLQRRFDGTDWLGVQDGRIGEALTAAAAAQSVADGKVDTFYQDEPPTTASEGDLWFDTNDGRKLYRWTGINWVVVQDTAIGLAITAAAGAQATADGKVTTFVGTEPPLALGVGDLWVDTDQGNKLYRWSGGQWQVVQDAGVGEAITAAAGAQATADGKVTTFVGPTPPTAEAVGDLWVNTSEGRKLYRWNGGAWAAVQDVGAEAAGNGLNSDGSVKDGKVGTGAIVAGAITVPATAKGADTTIPAGGTVDVQTSGWNEVGDLVDGGGMAIAFGEVDGGTTVDIGARINLFVDVDNGAGFVLGGTSGAGSRTSGGDTYMRGTVLAAASFAGVVRVRLKLQVVSEAMPGSTAKAFTFRSPQFVLFGGKR
jgi:hypothetical protein